MYVPVFHCVSARHYRFEGREKMGTHLIIKIYEGYISRKPQPVQVMVFISV